MRIRCAILILLCICLLGACGKADGKGVGYDFTANFGQDKSELISSLEAKGFTLEDVSETWHLVTTETIYDREFEVMLSYTSKEPCTFVGYSKSAMTDSDEECVSIRDQVYDALVKEYGEPDQVSDNRFADNWQAFWNDLPNPIMMTTEYSSERQEYVLSVQWQWGEGNPFIDE